MDKDATPAPLLGVLSLTPVTQGTQGLQVVLVEHVSQVVSGQGLIQHVHGPVVARGTCQMDREATPAPLLGTESLTLVTQGT